MKTTWYLDFIEKAKHFLVKDQSLMPTLFLKKGRSIGIVGLGNLLDHKDVAVAILKDIIDDQNPDEYLLLMESWIKVVDLKDKSDQSLSSLVTEGTLQVSQLPSKQECITLLHGTRTEEKLGTIVFKRKEGQIDFELIKWMEGDELKGRFTGLRSHKE